MPNIDPILFLQPILAVAMSLGAIIFWWNRKGFRGIVLLLTFAAYFVAIAAKYAIQIPTYAAVAAFFGLTSVGLGLYFGLQTVFLEVGLAYLIALYGARRRNLKTSDAVSYGLSLAFWENGILLGAVSILSLGVTYLLLGNGSSEAATVYSQLVTKQPSIFLPPASLLPSVLLGTLERFSSMLIHIAWGVLCVYAAASGRKKYLLYALPMGLVDALVPFASLNTLLFEVGIFILAVGFLLVAWRATEEMRLADGLRAGSPNQNVGA